MSTATVIEEVVYPIPPPQSRRSWYAFLRSPLWICLLIALVARIFLVFHTHAIIDGDEALVGIQGERILQGVFPIYFYGIPYFGSLEAYLAAIIFAIAGPSTWALRMEAALVSLLIVWLTWRLAAALADAAALPSYAKRNFMFFAALLAAVPPLYDAVIELRTFGGYVETFVLMLFLLLSVLRLTQRWHTGAMAREIALRWAGIGLIIGLGLWVYPLIASAILASMIWIACDLLVMFVRLRKEMFKAPQAYALACLKHILLAAAAIPAAVIGFTPAIIWGAKYQWANIAYILQLGKLSQPYSSSLRAMYPNRLALTRALVTLYTQCTAPRVVSGAIPFEGNPLFAIHTPLLMLGVFAIAAAAGIIVASFLYSHPFLSKVRQLVALPFIFAACTAFAYCTSTAAVNGLWTCDRDPTGRYTTPLLLALPFFLATVFTVISIYIQKKSQRRTQREQDEGEPAQGLPIASAAADSRARVSRIAGGVLSGFVALYLCMQLGTYGLADATHTFQSPYCVYGPADFDPIIAYLQREHINRVWAINFLAYPIVFKTNSQIIAVDPRPVARGLDTLNRIPEYTEEVLHADHLAMMVIVRQNDFHSPMLSMLDKAHVVYHVAYFPSEPGYDVMVVTVLKRIRLPYGDYAFADLFTCRQDVT